jgi:hypothetical protein
MAQSQLFIPKAQIHLIEESSQDTYSAPGGSGANMFLAEELTFTVESEEWEPAYAREDFLMMDMVPGTASATISFRLALRGGGAAGTAPEFSEALKACGYELNNTPSVSDVYTPLSVFDGTGGNPGPSYSVSILENGVRYAIAGAFGNVVFTAEVGRPIMAEFTFQGAYQAVADDALESPTYDTTTAPAFMGASFATNFGGSYTPKGVESFSLDTGNNVVIGRDVNKTYGVYGARIAGKSPSGNFTPEMELVATEDYFGNWRAGTAGTITTGTVGSTAGNIVQIDVGRCVTRAPSLVNRNNLRALDIPFKVSSNYTDVEGTTADITITFT